MEIDFEAPGLHAAVVVRRNEILAEHYGVGQDSCWLQPLGEVSFGPDTLHDMRSVTKSVTGLLYGIALGHDRGAGDPGGGPLITRSVEQLRQGQPRRTVTVPMTMRWSEHDPAG